ncbi:hypothetical protein J41TS4_32180 [Paenibacillus apis]|uniref:Uncharacterized protein n=1 Tax=Paenibacillus apis TaxID=1792174 RepID=A0A919Y713_9BACL|nr:hypothetical protein J41TS4_32180 [Paenibacillus apis]
MVIAKRVLHKADGKEPVKGKPAERQGRKVSDPGSFSGWLDCLVDMNNHLLGGGYVGEVCPDEYG